MIPGRWVILDQVILIEKANYENWLETAKEDPALIKENPRAWKGLMQIAQLMAAQKLDMLLIDK